MKCRTRRHPKETHNPELLEKIARSAQREVEKEGGSVLAAQEEAAKMKEGIVRAMDKALSPHRDRRAESAVLKMKRLGLGRRSSTVRWSADKDKC